MKKFLIALVVVLLVSFSVLGGSVNANSPSDEKLKQFEKAAVTVFVSDPVGVQYSIDNKDTSYESYGSGFAFNGQFVFTAAHVVEIAHNSPMNKEIYLIDKIGSYYRAQIYYYDLNQDIAILKTNKPSPLLEIDPSVPKIGEEVTTISSPLSKPETGLDETNGIYVAVMNFFHKEKNFFIDSFSFKGNEIWYGSSGGGIYSDTGYRGFIVSLRKNNMSQVNVIHAYQLIPILDQLKIPYLLHKQK